MVIRCSLGFVSLLRLQGLVAGLLLHVLIRLAHLVLALLLVYGFDHGPASAGHLHRHVDGALLLLTVMAPRFNNFGASLAEHLLRHQHSGGLQDLEGSLPFDNILEPALNDIIELVAVLHIHIGLDLHEDTDGEPLEGGESEADK